MKVDLKFNCPKKWNEMEGGDQVRHCSFCQKDVHNISKLTETEAEVLIGSDNSCVTMTVNSRGEIRTVSGFSKSLLWMGLAFGCGGDVETNKTTTQTTTDIGDPKVENLEVMGDVAPEEHSTMKEVVDPDCEGSIEEGKSSLIEKTGEVVNNKVSVETEIQLAGKPMMHVDTVQESQKKKEVVYEEKKKASPKNN